MVLFNHSTRELTAKIVYYGPGLCGKTTNLRLLHEKLDHGTTGRLLSLSTAQDRTIYFDLLPVELGNVKGYTVRFQLCTVPGQVFYNETRKLVLKGVDGVVFVVDSQWSMLSHNLESFQNLRENMQELGQSLDDTALVVQYNKRDLPGVLSVQALQESLGFQEFPFVESVAADARGVVETFKLVSKLTFVHLLKRLQRSPDGEHLGPDWISSAPPNSQATARIPAVGAELLALTSTVGSSASPPTDAPFETTGSWPGMARGEVFGDATIPPFPVELPPGPVPAPEEEAALIPAPPADADDTLTEPPTVEIVPPASPAPEPQPPPEAPATPEPPPMPEATAAPDTEPLAAPEPRPTEQEPVAEPTAETEAAPLVSTLDGVREPGLEPSYPLLALTTQETPEPAAVEPPPPPPAPEPPPPPPAPAVWAEAFAGLAARLDEMARVREEETARLEALARETREAAREVPESVREALAALAPAAAVGALREALDAHTAEVRPKLVELLAETARQRDAAFQREREQDDAARDAARRHREEIRGDVERAAAALREVVEALERRVAEMGSSLEARLVAVEAALSRLEASDRLEEVRREASEVRRLVEAKLEEAGGRNRKLAGFLRRALEELEPTAEG
jgi:hypothetical protein